MCFFVPRLKVTFSSMLFLIHVDQLACSLWRHISKCVKFIGTYSSIAYCRRTDISCGIAFVETHHFNWYYILCGRSFLITILHPSMLTNTRRQVVRLVLFTDCTKLAVVLCYIAVFVDVIVGVCKHVSFGMTSYVSEYLGTT